MLFIIILYLALASYIINSQMSRNDLICQVGYSNPSCKSLVLSKGCICDGERLAPASVVRGLNGEYLPYNTTSTIKIPIEGKPIAEKDLMEKMRQLVVVNNNSM